MWQPPVLNAFGPSSEDRSTKGLKRAAKDPTPIILLGLEVKVPLFMKEGEVVRVNTQTGDVAGRA